MPGAKFPSGYPRHFHEIAIRLMDERPQFVRVALPGNPIANRAQFNYFRQSWLRHYEFLSKNKSFQQANLALDTYNRLISYTVQVDGPYLTFTSKEAPIHFEIESYGRVEPYFHNQLPMREGSKPTLAGKKRGEKQVDELYQEYTREGLKDADNMVRQIFPKGGQFIPDNPPQEPPSPVTTTPSIVPISNEEEYAFFLAAGRNAKDADELLRWRETGAVD